MSYCNNVTDVSHTKIQSQRNAPRNNMLPMLHYMFSDGMLTVIGWAFQILHFWDQVGERKNNFPAHEWSIYYSYKEFKGV